MKEGQPMHIRSLFVTALLALGTASPVLAQAPAAGTDLWKECQSQQSDQALKACTAIIDAKSEPTPKLAQAYNMRALAHQRMGQPDKAIADFGQAI
jgi:tetratricopeptide (TPR) repeat protein